MSFRLPGPLLVLDVETTGLDPAHYDICEIGAAVLTEHLEIIETFESLVQPQSSMRDPVAMGVHGIPEVLLQAAPSLKNVMLSFDRLVLKHHHLTLAGWGVSFDESFLKTAYARVGTEYPLSYRKFDIKSAVQFYLAMQGKNSGWHGLGPALKAVGLTFEGREHSATADVINTVRLLRRCAGVI